MEKIMIAKTCPFCGTVTRVDVERSQLKNYKNGALIQNAFPNLSPTEREVLITGMCENCQSDFFAEDDEC